MSLIPAIIFALLIAVFLVSNISSNIAAYDHDNDLRFGTGMLSFGVLVIAVCVLGLGVTETVEKETAIKMLNNEITCDTLAITPNGKILDVEIKRHEQK